jgi:gliding motility-associated-like protein
MKKVALLLFILLASKLAIAQCNAPAFSINLSGAADTTYVLSGQVRGGTCCGSSNCVTFTVTTHPNSELISFDVTNPSPSGSAYYQVNCGTPVSIGTPLCIVGLPSPFTITYCKPGGDKPDYVITAGTVVHASQDISLHKTGCIDTLTVSNVVPSSVVWTSIFPGAPGAYNSYLSCTSGCTSTLVTPGPNPPTYVDFEVSGTPNTTCGASFDKDTVRVYFVPNLTGTITPTNPIICASSGTQIQLTANPSGGAVPYNYTWSTGPHSQSINVNNAGTYTVVIGDNTKCPKISLTKTISTLPSATFAYAGGGYCKNGTNPTPTYSGNGQPGVFTASPSGLSFVNSSTGEINLGASAPGTYTVTNFITASNGCPNVSATATVTIYAFPAMTSAATATLCTGSTVNITLSSSSAATYEWIASDNLNTSGESLTTQNTATLSNTLANASSVSQLVLYTVTPTSSLAGGCVGTSQTVSVTVLPLDNAGFSYSSSTFCQTATYPTATITGLPGGTFSSTPGLVFINTSTGYINLSSSTVGTYSVTYTTNGACPNSSSFPITITTAPSAAFSFTASPYCNNEANPFPSFGAGASGGTFSSTAGLVFVSNLTGEINLSASTPGTYTVTNSIPSQAGCAPASATGTITITELKNATFSFPGSPYCQNAGNPSPAFAAGAVAGTFTSQAGLSINAGTGQVNLSGSTPGTYTVTNTIAATGGCPPVISTATISITPLPVASFTYTGTPYCSNGTNPVPAFTGGGTAGVFSASSVFLNLNTSTGVINLSNSTAGGFLITNTIPAAAGCPAVSATASVTITALPVANFSFTASPYCQNAVDPTPVLSVNGANGIYTAAPSGLSIDINAGTIDLSASVAGSYTVTNTIPAAAGCPAVVATGTLAITALPVGTFTYAGTPYCVNQVNPVPLFTGGGTAGTFASTTGLSLNTSNGQVSLSGSTPGTYTVTNTIPAASGCPVVTEQAAITVIGMDNPGFSYAGSTFCQTGVDPLPTISGLPGGTFSSGSLIVNSSSGSIDLSASPLGTYTVGYTTSGACPNSSTFSVTISVAPSASFSYPASPFCSSGTNPTPTFPPGSSAGIYSSASGLVVDSLTGLVNLSASTPGTYTITNTIAASGGCATATANTTLVIDPAATANASADQIVCFGSNAPMAGTVGGGASSGTWSGGSGSFSPNATNLNASYVPTSADSLAGIITVTLTTNDPAGICPAVTDLMTITISQPAVANASADQTICFGSSVVLAGVTGGSATSATWSGGAGSYTPNDSTLNASYIPTAADSAAGSVTLTLTTNDPAGVCPAVTDAMTLTINQPATANANVNQAICFGSQVTMVGAVGGSASNGTWSGGTGSFSPSPTTLNANYNPTAADSASGVCVLVLTSDDPAGICPAVSDTMVININQPAVAGAGIDQTLCFGVNASLAGVIGGSAVLATWTGGNGTYSPNDSTLNASYLPSSADSAAGTVTFVLTTNDPAGVCPAVTDTMQIAIQQPATVNASADQVICYGSNVALAGNFGGSAGAATWDGGAGSFSPDSTALNATYVPNAADSTAGTVTLVLTTNDPAGVCPAVSDTMQIMISQPATVTANADQVICYGSTVALAGGFGGSTGSATWTGGNGSYSPNANTPGAIYTPASADSLAGTISLTLTTNDPAGVCPAVSDVMNISIEQPATVNAGSNQAICYGSAVTLAGNFGGSADTVTWSGGSGSFLPDANTPGATYVPTAADSAAGSVTLTLTTNDPSGVCNSVSDAMTVAISQPATINANADQVICFGDSVSLAGAIGGSATSASWTGGAGSFVPNANVPGAVYVASSADSLAGTISLVISTNDPNGVCTAVSDTMQITFNQPALANAGASQVVCFGGPVSLPGSIGGSATSGTWSGGNGTFSPNANTLNASYSPSGADSLAGSVTLTLTTDDPSGVCPALSSTVLITINPLPNVPVLSANGYTYCEADAIGAITANGTGTVLWSTSPSMSPVVHTGATFTPAGLTVGTTTYYVLDSLSSGCKSVSTASVAITINSTPPVPVLSASSYTYCQNAAVSAITSNGSSTMIWSTSPTLSPVVHVGSSYTPVNLPTGATVFYVADSTLQGCKSTGTASVVIMSYPNPVMSGSPVVDSANCGLPTGAVTGVTVIGGTPGYTYQWYNGSTPIVGANTDSLTGAGAGTYSVLVTDANGCVASGASTSFTIAASSNISSSFTLSATEGIAPLTVAAASTSANASGYAWTMGDGSSSTLASAQTTYTAAGTYTVTLVTTNGTCMSVTSQTVLVDGVPEIVIPNIFTPNGDGINDLFTIYSVAITEMHVDLYNRWGTLIHTLDGVKAAWDGKNSQNTDMSDGTYFVILKAKDRDGKTHERQGYVTLTR